MRGATPALRAALLLMLLNAALLGVLWQDSAADGVDAAAVSAPEPETDAAVSASSHATGSAPVDLWAAAALTRPLFDPRRRPGTSRGEPRAAGLPRLTGVVVGPEERLAFFLDLAGGQPQVLREGGMISAYVVQVIRPGEAIIIGPQGQHVLHPSFSFEPSSPRPQPSWPPRGPLP